MIAWSVARQAGQSSSRIWPCMRRDTQSGAPAPHFSHVSCSFAGPPVPLFWLFAFSVRFASMATIETSSFGKTADGKDVILFKLRNGKGLEVHLMSYGAGITKILAPDR